ncbi:MAG: hypothetical protein V1760_02420, partial [Candidatus Peregrinibacteria bacterium]
DLGFIQSTTKRNAVNREDLKAEQFQVLTKGKRIVGFCRERALSDAVQYVWVICIYSKVRVKNFGYHLMKKFF